MIFFPISAMPYGVTVAQEEMPFCCIMGYVGYRFLSSFIHTWDKRPCHTAAQNLSHLYSFQWRKGDHVDMPSFVHHAEPCANCQASPGGSAAWRTWLFWCLSTRICITKHLAWHKDNQERNWAWGNISTKSQMTGIFIAQICGHFGCCQLLSQNAAPCAVCVHYRTSYRTAGVTL